MPKTLGKRQFTDEQLSLCRLLFRAFAHVLDVKAAKPAVEQPILFLKDEESQVWTDRVAGGYFSWKSA